MGQKRKVGVIFGGRSVEHDVSIITGLQIIRALDRERYEVVPIYISKNGEWYTGNALTDIGSFLNFDPDVIGATRAAIPPDRGVGGLITPLTSGWLRSSKVIPLDVVFPCVHGTHGEDGTLQGLLEMADLPYVGCDVVSSAIGMNKVMTKKILRYHGLPILDFLIIGKYEWQLDSNQAIARISDKFRYPLFVKPVALGSSIGISKAQNETELREALETALSFDDAAMIESAVENMIEVNCAVLGDSQELTASACEQPIPWQDFLSYEDKYMRGKAALGMKGAERKIPAPISETLRERIQKTAVQAFQAIGGCGIARIDFFVNQKNREGLCKRVKYYARLTFFLFMGADRTKT